FGLLRDGAACQRNCSVVMLLGVFDAGPRGKDIRKIRSKPLRFGARGQAFFNAFRIGAAKLMHAAPDMRNAGVSQRKIGILLDSLIVHRKGVLELTLTQIISAAKKEIIGLWVYGGFARDDLFFLRRERDFQSFSDAERDFLLNRKHVFHVAVVTFGPDGMASGAFDELGSNAETVASATDGAFKDVHGAKLFADFGSGYRLVTELQHL